MDSARRTARLFGLKFKLCHYLYQPVQITLKTLCSFISPKQVEENDDIYLTGSL